MATRESVEKQRALGIGSCSYVKIVSVKISDGENIRFCTIFNICWKPDVIQKDYSKSYPLYWLTYQTNIVL